MAAATIIHGDARHLPLADSTVDAVICDPPYSLSFMGRSWDSHDSPAAFQAWCEEWAREALRVLKPGGHLIAFGGTRTFHRLTCAIEDAGFGIRDSIGHAHTVPVMGWTYGSGFPKSHNVSAAIDRAAGAEREVVGRNFRARISHGSDKRNFEQGKRGQVYNDTTGCDITAPATDDARRWQGWGTALKPAWEPIVVARKPLAGKTVAQNVLTYGCGALNIDATRVAATPDLYAKNPHTRSISNGFGEERRGATYDPSAGRWPSNVVFSHPPRLDVDGQVIGDACADGCVDGCAVAELDTQSGVRTSGKMRPTHTTAQRQVYGQNAAGGYVTMETYGDSGTASRFFPTFRYQAKAPSRERPKVDGVAHPCVKPLELLKFLARLVGGQPGSLILDMFAGSGSTIEAALLEGFNAVGVEQAAEYLPLIQHRIDRATAQLAAQQPAEPEAEPTLFDVA